MTLQMYEIWGDLKPRYKCEPFKPRVWRARPGRWAVAMDGNPFSVDRRNYRPDPRSWQFVVGTWEQAMEIVRRYWAA